MPDVTNTEGAGGLVSLAVTREQLALIRQLVYRDLQNFAEALAEEAHKSHEPSRDDSGLSGDDAETACRIVRENAELLDVLGWSIRDDLDVVFPRRKAAVS